MPTTTNYGWDIPADTDLVKDGALAMRTLGNSIDTTTKNLNPETTLGDLAYRSSTANVKTRLGIGTNGQVLTVSGGVPAWATPAAGGMTELASGSLSSTAVNLTSISGSYRDLILRIRNFKPTSDGKLNFRLQNDSNNRYFYLNAVMATNETFQRNIISADLDLDSGTTNGFIQLTIYDYANTTTWKTGEIHYLGSNGTTPANAVISTTLWAYNQTGAVNQINILDGNATGFTGTYILYGVS